MFHVTFNPRTNPKHRATGSQSELSPVTVKVSEADVMASGLPAISILLLLFWEVCAAGEKCVCWGGGGGGDLYCGYEGVKAALEGARSSL